jgi:hypothetical protein
MKTGSIVKRSKLNHHLDNDEWVEVFPDGNNPHEILMLNRLPKEHKTFSQRVAMHQSPILVRRVMFDAMEAQAKKSLATVDG